jgi:hypothetical protein
MLGMVLMSSSGSRKAPQSDPVVVVPDDVILLGVGHQAGAQLLHEDVVGDGDRLDGDTVHLAPLLHPFDLLLVNRIDLVPNSQLLLAGAGKLRKRCHHDSGGKECQERKEAHRPRCVVFITFSPLHCGPGSRSLRGNREGHHSRTPPQSASGYAMDIRQRRRHGDGASQHGVPGRARQAMS